MQIICRVLCKRFATPPNFKGAFTYQVLCLQGTADEDNNTDEDNNARTLASISEPFFVSPQKQIRGGGCTQPKQQLWEDLVDKRFHRRVARRCFFDTFPPLLLSVNTALLLTVTLLPEGALNCALHISTSSANSGRSGHTRGAV